MASDCVAETFTVDKESFCSVNIQKLHVLPTEYIFAFCIDLTTNRKYFPMQHLLTASYNRDAMCSLRGNLIFKCNSRFFFSFLKCYTYQSTEILEKTPSRSGHVIQEKRGWHPNWQKANWSGNSLPRTGSLSSNPWKGSFQKYKAKLPLQKKATVTSDVALLTAPL